ncbi:MAG: cupredoxin domain-containing protein [Nitrososphaeraceae archaeon]
MTTEDESHIIRTTGRRMAKGLAIIVVVIAFGAAVAVPNWHNFAKNPPPVSTITTKAASSGGTEGGTTTAGGGASSGAVGGGGGTAASTQPAAALPPGATAITILAGASVQGNPNYEPADGKVPLASKVVWQNKDTTVHTATSGSGATDANSGKAFDTKMINAGSNSDPVEIKNVKVGDVLAYYCQIHPYMTAKLTVTAASASSSSSSSSSSQGNATSSPAAAGAGGAAGTASTSPTAASGPTLSIPQGASVQGNPSYQPATLSVKTGDTVQVLNKDQSPHTVTSGKTLEDPNKGKDFDTSIISPSASAKISTASLKAGEYPFHCDLHPYMTGTLKVQ